MFGVGPGHKNDTKCSFETCMVETKVAKTTTGELRQSIWNPENAKFIQFSEF
jgi:hypothetical protein